MNNTKASSYTSASAMPLKVCFHSHLMEKIKSNKRIIPVHMQVIPTNRCNLKCSFCSCKERDKNMEMSIHDYKNLLEISYKLGCQAFTITGGGEPLLHPDINEMIYETTALGVQIGIVTNGLLLDNLTETSLRQITWCRVSASDERDFDKKSQEIVRLAVEKSVGHLDWAFSYVISKNFNSENFVEYVKFANRWGFTHVRAVTDLTDIKHAFPMSLVKKSLIDAGVNDSLVIYQDRQQYTTGREKCLISLLKPVIGVDGMIYPCCGVQYAKLKQALDMPDYMNMGHFGTLANIIFNQQYFNGSMCQCCYYSKYNELLEFLTTDITHGNFL